MNLKLKKSDINILIMIAGIVLVIVSYFLIYQRLTANTETLKAENAVLGQEVDYLQQLADNKQQYIDDTVSMQAEIDNIKSQFPAEYRPEDEILYVVDLQKKYKMISKSIRMESSAAIEVVTQQQQEAAAAQEAQQTTDGGTVVDAGTSTVETAPEVTAPEIVLYRTPVTVDMLAGYESVKDIINVINTDENRKSIDTITVEFDTDTGDLKAMMAFSMYSLGGTEAVYTTPEVSGITYGTPNIFNSATKKSAIEAERRAQREADTSEDAEE